MRDPLFWAALVLLLVAKAAATLGTTELGIDGSFYTDVAQHVRDGHGLVTGQSLYHKGYPFFPHPTSVYPVWPLLYGLLARLVDIEWLGHWLPAALYGACLVAAWRLGSRLLPVRRGPLHGGHVLMLLLGLNSEFFVYTSMPYTEGLGWLLLLLFGERLFRAGEGWRGGLELGLWAGVLVLCRAQFLLVPIALFAALLLRLPRDPARAGLRLLCAAASFSVVLAPHMVRSAGFLHRTGVLTLLRFDQAQVDATIAPLPVLVSSAGLPELLMDRASGLLVAFDPLSADSYFVHLYGWALALAALPLIAARAAWRRRAQLLSPEATPWIVLGLFALGGLASIHLAHKTYEPAWYFHRRHALVVLPAVFAGVAGLWTLNGRWGLAGLLLFLVGAGQGSWDIGQRALAGEVSSWAATPKRVKVQRWIVEQEAHTVLITSPDAQRLAWRTPGVGFHSVHERTSPQVFAQLAALSDLVVLHDASSRDWDFRPGLQAPQGFEEIEAPRGFIAYRRRP